jgi:hypothetical protein
MGSPALNYFQVEELKASILTDAHVGPVLVSSVSEVFASPKEVQALPVPTSEGLKGARAAMVAIGLEAVAGLGLYGVWQVWHILR